MPAQDRSGVTIRRSRLAWDNNRLSAADTARSAQDSRGRWTWRRNTATSWRSTRISALFDVELRASNPSQATSCRNKRYTAGTRDTADALPRSAIMPDRHRPVTPQVIGVDDRFGTHTVLRLDSRLQEAHHRRRGVAGVRPGWHTWRPRARTGWCFLGSHPPHRIGQSQTRDAQIKGVRTLRVSARVDRDPLYDVCLSFAGEQREYVDRVAKLLVSADVRVFYDRYETADLWGEDLVAHFDNVYRKRAKFCVMFVSVNYAQKVWTTHERCSAQARAMRSASAYILPVRFDDTEIPGLLETVGFLNANDLTPDQIADFVVAKLAGPKGSATVRPLEYAPRSGAAYRPNASHGQVDQIVADDDRGGRENRAGAPNRIVASQLYGMTTVLGREEILDELAEVFFDGVRLSVNRPTLQVISGIGGIGKTSIAREYGAQNQDRYGLIWWIRAENSELAVVDFRGLLLALGLPDVERLKNPVQHAHVLLGNRQDRWLLVFDNVPQQADLRGFLPPDGLGDVLVTSRSSTWPSQSMMIPVTPLANEVGVRLLLDISRDDNESAAAELVDELGGLPLALQQAASYVSENPIDLADYLRLYREHRPSLHRKGNAPDYDLRVGTTWEVSFHMLPDTARSVLNVLSWCSPEDIPLDLLVRSGPMESLPDAMAARVSAAFSNELDYFNAVGTLAGYGLITITGRDASVHRLIQAVTRDDAEAGGESESWAAVTAALLYAAVPRPPANADRVTRWRRLRPHFHHYLRITPLQDHAETLRLRHWMAQWTGELGRPTEAADMFADLIKLQTQVLGSNHDDTLRSRHSLAQWTGEAGELDRAIRLFDTLIADRSRLSGPDDPETLRAVHSSAYWIGESGAAAKACGRLEDVLRRRERVLGMEHPDTLRTKHSLAFRTGEAGKPEAACEMLAQLLPVRARVLGPDHPHTLRTRYSLAQWIGHGGDPSRARDMTALLLTDQTRILGAEHPHTLRTRYNLAHWTGEAGDTETRIELLITLLVDQNRILGPDHPDTRRTRSSLPSS